MAIEVRSTKGAATKQGVKLLIVAESGFGKTNLARSTGKTIIISAEGGDLTLNDVDVDSIRVKNLNDLKEAYQYVKDHVKDYDTVIVDSWTEITEQIVAELKQMPEYQGMNKSMPMWLAFTELATSIAKSFRDLDGINVVLLALPEAVKVGYDDKILPLMPAKKAQAKLGSLYDEVLMIKVDEEGNREFVCQPTSEFSAKDRSGKLPATVPYDKDKGLKPVFNMILGGKQ